MTDAGRLQQMLMQLFRDELFLDVQGAEVDLFTEGLLDSLVFVDLVVRLESLYNVEIPLSNLDPERFRTIERIAEYVRQEMMP